MSNKVGREARLGEFCLGASPETLTASGIGSCVVITLYDAKRKIGALSHAIAPLPEDAEASAYSDTRFVTVALDKMLEALYAQGSRSEDLQAKMIGGAQMFAVVTPVSQRNISAVREKLRRERIYLAGECVGGSQGRSVEFSLISGIVTVKVRF